MTRSNSQIDKPQHGHPKKTGLPDVNINTGAQSINTERASLTEGILHTKRHKLDEMLLSLCDFVKWIFHIQSSLLHVIHRI